MVSMLVLGFNMVATCCTEWQIYLSACSALSVEEEQKVSVDSKLKEHSSHRLTAPPYHIDLWPHAHLHSLYLYYCILF